MSFLGIASPSKLFKWIGSMTMAGAEIGIDGGSAGVAKAMRGAIASAAEEASSARPAVSLAASMSADRRAGSAPAYEALSRPSQTFVFNHPVESPDEFARTMRMQERYGLAAEC